MNTNIFIEFPVLETKRVRIRKMVATDIDVVYDFNSCHESLQYIIRNPFKSKKEAQDKLNFFLSGIDNKFAFWWVFTLKETGEDIGYGGLFDISSEHSRAEIGYALIKKYWNKGYMSEIAAEIIRYGIETAQFHKIYGVIISGNQASIRLLEKHHFEKEAHFKGHSLKDGQYIDETVYSLINNNF